MSFRIAASKGFEPPRQLFFSVLYYFFLTCGLVGLAYAGAVVSEGYLYQAVEKARLENTASAAPIHILTAEPAVVMEGTVLGSLEAPRLGMKVIVDEGVSDKILRRAVGHIPQTALPGEWGNVVLAGHRDTFFRPLRRIQTGDQITLKTPRGEYEYRVETSVVVAPTDVRLLKPTEDRMLTLVTCFPFSYVGPAPERFIVRARLVKSSVEPPE
jgi:sortase A